jgi:hypothetical protein
MCHENLDSVKKYQRHVGKHQEQLAIFALPSIQSQEEDGGLADDGLDDDGLDEYDSDSDPIDNPSLMEETPLVLPHPGERVVVGDVRVYVKQLYVDGTDELYGEEHSTREDPAESFNVNSINTIIRGSDEKHGANIPSNSASTNTGKDTDRCDSGYSSVSRTRIANYSSLITGDVGRQAAKEMVKELYKGTK